MAMMMAYPDSSGSSDTTGMGGGNSASPSGSGGGMGSLGFSAQAGGDLLSGIGALYAGEMESNALDAQANLQRQNASLDLAAGRANAMRSQIMSGQRMGALEGAAAASGVTESGSVLSLMAASSMNAEMDRQEILHGAQVRAIQAENQATMDELGAKSALNGAYFKAIGGGLQSGLIAAALLA